MILGNTQQEGIDSTNTFALVAKMVTVRTLLSVASAQNTVHQTDVHKAFLHGDLVEKVYMHLLPGFRTSSPHHVCRLKKSLYDLWQAPRCWFSKLTIALYKCSFT